MSTQKKVWLGVAVLAAVALLAVPYTAYANRQREAGKVEAQRQAEAARWEAMGDYYLRQAAQSETLQLVREAEAARWEALAAQRQREQGGDTSVPLPLYDATVIMERPTVEVSTMPAVDWDAVRVRMTAEPGYSPAAARPTAAPTPHENGR